VKQAPKRLLLFDIDGTLVDAAGAGIASLREGFFDAFPEHLGTPFPTLELGGATDGALAMGLFSHFGLPDTPAHRIRFYQRYTLRLEVRLRRSAEEGRGRLLPGVGELLERLAADGGHRLALLTGNLREGAAIKLRHFRIDHHFPTGAYGDDHHDRNELGPIASLRAREVYGEEFAPAETVVIGDTPRDIACARAFGAKVLAVATGAATHEQLHAARPDLLLEDLSDADRVIRGIESLAASQS
jgi:phosphoglycolate phosphatase